MSEAISRPAPLIGRAREWRALEARCERVQQGRGGLFWLVGEAGIGKSALMGVLDTWAETQGFAVLRGRHVGHRQAPPLHGLREMLRQLFALMPADGPAAVEQRVGELLQRRWPDLLMHRKVLVQFLEPLMVEEAEVFSPARSSSSNLYYFVFRLLAAVAREKPLLLLLDDCHWADASTLEFLEYLVGLLADQPILLVGAYRPEESDPQARLAELVLDKEAESLAFSRLDLDAVTQMAAAHDMGTDEAFCQQLHRLTEGIPLFVEQCLLEYQSAEDASFAALPAHRPDDFPTPQPPRRRRTGAGADCRGVRRPFRRVAHAPVLRTAPVPDPRAVSRVGGAASPHRGRDGWRGAALLLPPHADPPGPVEPGAALTVGDDLAVDSAQAFFALVYLTQRDERGGQIEVAAAGELAAELLFAPQIAQGFCVVAGLASRLPGDVVGAGALVLVQRPVEFGDDIRGIAPCLVPRSQDAVGERVAYRPPAEIVALMSAFPLVAGAQFVGFVQGGEGVVEQLAVGKVRVLLQRVAGFAVEGQGQTAMGLEVFGQGGGDAVEGLAGFRPLALLEQS